MRTDIREAILDAVDRRLARFGYKKMTVEGLADEAGIGKGTVYLHFASKEEAVLSHVDRIVERLCGRLDTIAAGAGPVDQRIHAMLVERVLDIAAGGTAGLDVEGNLLWHVSAPCIGFRSGERR